MIRIRTLGSLTVSRDGVALSGAGTQARRMAVLALLARAGSRGITRDRLIALLWPDADEQSSRAALSQATGRPATVTVEPRRDPLDVYA